MFGCGLYACGPAAVVALVEHLQQTVTDLTARIDLLEERLGRNSRNSNQPPSSDGFNRPPRSSRPPSGKKPGGQPGHPGQTLRFSAHPDHIIVQRPTHCEHCGRALPAQPPVLVERRQVVDVPPLALETTEYHVEQYCCPHCTQITSGSFPPEASEPVQYGPRLKALGLYLGAYQLLPYARCSQLLNDLFGVAPSLGTLVQAQHDAATTLAPAEEALRQGLQQAAVAHFDDTGLYIKGQRQWLHVASTARLTLYLPHPKRGAAATDAMGVLPEFRGVAVHDSYASFWRYPCDHALCNAHLVRELRALAERGDQPWAAQLQELLVEIKRTVEAAAAAGQPSLSTEQHAAFAQRYRQLLDEGLTSNPPAPPAERPRRGRVKQSRAYNLLVRLRDHEAAVLRFMYDWRVPFDNNQAERDLRMAKVQQKISGCFRSAAGAQAFCRVRGYISTLRKQGIHVLTALEQLFRGTVLMPSLQAE